MCCPVRPIFHCVGWFCCVFPQKIQGRQEEEEEEEIPHTHGESKHLFVLWEAQRNGHLGRYQRCLRLFRLSWAMFLHQSLHLRRPRRSRRGPWSPSHVLHLHFFLRHSQLRTPSSPSQWCRQSPRLTASLSLFLSGSEVLSKLGFLQISCGIGLLFVSFLFFVLCCFFFPVPFPYFGIEDFVFDQFFFVCWYLSFFSVNYKLNVIIIKINGNKLCLLSLLVVSHRCLRFRPFKIEIYLSLDCMKPEEKFLNQWPKLNWD